MGIGLLRQLVGKVVAYPVRRQLAAFEAATYRPREVQENLLSRILAYHADTDFGREHHFASLRSLADFRQQLPIAGYEHFEPYLQRVRRGDFKALLADRCVHMFALTSGTTAARKYIPVTPQYLADYRRGWNIWGLRAYWDHPEIKLRPIVQMSADWDEYRTEANIPCGSVTGLTATAQKRIIRFVYCVPACVARIKDVAAKYYVALRLSLPRQVGMIIAANPSTLINLARAGDQDKESLIRDLYDGTLSTRVDVPPSIRTALAWRIRRCRRRARELEAIVHRVGNLYPRDYWPPHCLLGNWTGGSVRAYLRHYPRYYGDKPVRDVGLIASEGRMTIPFSDATPSGVLDITSHFFEFIPEEEAGLADPTVLSAHEVQEGKTYFIVPTTAFGLYRYHISDLVRVTGFYNQTPLIEFLSKGAHFANITGEKLSEYHVTQAMEQVLRTLNVSLTAYSLAPCWHEELPYYGLFVERGDLVSPEQGSQLVEILDEQLRQINCEYASKRDTARLGAVRLQLLPKGTWQSWAGERLARTGGAMEQYKHPCLIADDGFRESMPVEQEIGAGEGISVRIDSAASSGHPRHATVPHQPGEYGRV
ncbi:MAG TPA: GH3 auxin-responsive promoter family protein [Gemmataceae bacterium]|nr:GH3 auxin-responsive promoter family protein [Gemmataceae bacterium]